MGSHNFDFPTTNLKSKCTPSSCTQHTKLRRLIGTFAKGRWNWSSRINRYARELSPNTGIIKTKGKLTLFANLKAQMEST